MCSLSCANCVIVAIAVEVHCKIRGVTEHSRGAIFYCFRGNSIGYHGNSKILLPWGVPIHRVFYSVAIKIRTPLIVTPVGGMVGLGTPAPQGQSIEFPIV